MNLEIIYVNRRNNMRRRRNFRKGGRPRRFHTGGYFEPSLNQWLYLNPHDHPHAPGGPYPSSLPGIVPGHLTPGSIYSTSTAKRFKPPGNPRPIPRPPGPGMPPPRIPDIYRRGGGIHAGSPRSGLDCGGGRAMSNSNGCGPGYHMMPDGTCMAGDYHGQYGNGYAHGGHIAPGVGVCDEPSTAIDGFGNNIC